MPYWFVKEKKRVGKEQDKRRKLTDKEIDLIKELYAFGVPIRKITRIIVRVSRRAIQWHLKPELRKRWYEYKKERGYDYNRRKHNKAIRLYRKHLKEIYGLKRSIKK